MSVYRRENAVNGNWTRWVSPRHRGYKVACCDCGLVHVVDFRVVTRPNGRQDVELRARRDNRATGQVRRHKRAAALLSRGEG